MEPIHLSGYISSEKQTIALRFLLPKQIRSHHLSPTQIQLSPSTILSIIQKYTYEPGVRGLERELGSVVRYKAVEWGDARDSGVEAEYDPVIEEEDLEKILGVGRYDQELMEEGGRVGVVAGLAYMGSGNGGILLVEAVKNPTIGGGKLKLTGSLGEVISESANIALSWIKANAFSLGITETPQQDVMKNIDIHLHLPSGSVKKDGPSAGIAMISCLYSLLSSKVPLPLTAMTGEITLSGNVTPVGGIKEKIIGAHRAGIKRVILPYKNEKDVLADLPTEVKEDMEFFYVKRVEEVLEKVFEVEKGFVHVEMKEEVERQVGAEARRQSRL